MYEKKTESIKFRAEAVIYTDQRKEFKIIRGVGYSENGTECLGEFSIKGNMPDIRGNEELFLTGYWDEHPKYGRSLRVTAYVVDFPHTADKICAYLEQGWIAGVTPTRAKRIVSAFGDSTLEVLQNEPERLAQVYGIGAKSIEKISKSAKEELGSKTLMKAIMVYIRNFDISPAYAQRIYNTYGDQSLHVIQTNPYQLAEDVKGIGFVKADEIAMHNGLSKDHPFRVESAILYIIKSMRDEGHVFGEINAVSEQALEYLKIDQSHITAAITRLIERNDLKVFGTDLYLPNLYYAERRAASNLVRLKAASRTCFNVSDKDIETMEQGAGISYADAQVKAIRTACASSVVVITGGPGTGKTTITNSIIQLCRKQRLLVACAAPTGKAAKRMKEATGVEAKTIHKLLEAFYDEENKKMAFNRNADNPLDEDVLIVDESSMIDISLFDHLLKAVRTGMKLIMVGDIDQLPSVGCGNVLHDVISSSVIPVERLSVIFRQADQSRIIRTAHLINEGTMPDLTIRKDDDFFFVKTQGMEQETIRDTIVQYACENLPRYYGVSPDEVQVLAPMKKGHTGVYELNSFIQDRMHPNKDGKFLTSGGTVFYEGDKVMCTVNDYEMLVFNGDVGKIVRIKTEIDDADEDQYFIVDFDGVIKKLPLKKISNFVLSYAMTIHKSQGSEYEIVVMPLTCQNFIMLQRNLLYTGITRAKKICVLIGDVRAVQIAVRTLKVIKRNTHLSELIQEAAKKVEKAGK